MGEKEKHITFFTKIVLRVGIFLLFFCAIFSSAHAASAASLSMSAPKNTYAIGDTFTASVYLSTSEAANAIQGSVTFPSDKLQLTSLSKSGSIITLWVQEPSSGSGSANFEGVVLNPGYTGSRGKVISLVFKVKASGAAAVKFSSGSILANDGQGTNILNSMSGLQLTLNSSGAADTSPSETVSPTPTNGVPNAPSVTSANFPDQSAWYAINNPTFTWGLPKGLTGISIALSKVAGANPGTRSDGLFAEYSYKDVEDGTTYFHIRSANSSGWSPITHYRLQIDTKPPEQFTAAVTVGASTTLKAKATDALSGVAYYTVKVDAAEALKVDAAQIEAGTYVLENLITGKHTVVVKAFDKAGNTASATADFLEASPQAPVFTDYPSELSDGDILILKGTTYPNAMLSIWLQRDSKDINRYTLRAKEDGSFMFIGVDRVKGGLYQIWAEAVTDHDLRTDVSKPIFINVKQALFWKIASELQTYLAVLIPVVASLIILGLLLMHGVRKIVGLRRRIRREVTDVENEIHEAFNILRDDLQAHLKLLDKAKSKRDLTVEEEKLASRLKKDIDLAEKTLRKKVEAIEKEV